MFQFADITFLAGFLFIFAVVYGLLTTAKIMNQKNVNIIIALVFAFFSASYTPFARILQGLLPVAGIIIFLLFLLMFIRKIISSGNKKDSLPLIACLAAILIMFSVIGSDFSAFFYSIGLEPANMLWIVGIIIVAMIFYAVYMHSTSS